MRYTILLLMLVCLGGCGEIGGAGVLTHYKTVTQEEMDSICLYNNGGCAQWTFNYDYRLYDTCTIYTLPMDQYPSEEEFYFTMGHEARHCRDGHFHPYPPELPKPEDVSTREADHV